MTTHALKRGRTGVKVCALSHSQDVWVPWERIGRRGKVMAIWGDGIGGNGILLVDIVDG